MTVRKILSRLNPRLKWRGIRGLRYNEQGISAVEFALIAPLLITLYLGAIELSLLMEADRRVTQTSASLEAFDEVRCQCLDFAALFTCIWRMSGRVGGNSWRT